MLNRSISAIIITAFLLTQTGISWALRQQVPEGAAIGDVARFIGAPAPAAGETAANSSGVIDNLQEALRKSSHHSYVSVVSRDGEVTYDGATGVRPSDAIKSLMFKHNLAELVISRGAIVSYLPLRSALEVDHHIFSALALKDPVAGAEAWYKSEYNQYPCSRLRYNVKREGSAFKVSIKTPFEVFCDRVLRKFHAQTGLPIVIKPLGERFTNIYQDIRDLPGFNLFTIIDYSNLPGAAAPLFIRNIPFDGKNAFEFGSVKDGTLAAFKIIKADHGTAAKMVEMPDFLGEAFRYISDKTGIRAVFQFHHDDNSISFVKPHFDSHALVASMDIAVTADSDIRVETTGGREPLKTFKFSDDPKPTTVVAIGSLASVAGAVGAAVGTGGNNIDAAVHEATLSQAKYRIRNFNQQVRAGVVKFNGVAKETGSMTDEKLADEFNAMAVEGKVYVYRDDDKKELSVRSSPRASAAAPTGATAAASGEPMYVGDAMKKLSDMVNGKEDGYYTIYLGSPVFDGYGLTREHVTPDPEYDENSKYSKLDFDLAMISDGMISDGISDSYRKVVININGTTITANPFSESWKPATRREVAEAVKSALDELAPHVYKVSGVIEQVRSADTLDDLEKSADAKSIVKGFIGDMLAAVSSIVGSRLETEKNLSALNSAKEALMEAIGELIELDFSLVGDEMNLREIADALAAYRNNFDERIDNAQTAVEIARNAEQRKALVAIADVKAASLTANLLRQIGFVTIEIRNVELTPEEMAQVRQQYDLVITKPVDGPYSITMSGVETPASRLNLEGLRNQVEAWLSV